MLDGATVKEYEDEEVEYAVQSSVADVSSEDVRYMVRLFAFLLIIR